MPFDQIEPFPPATRRAGRGNPGTHPRNTGPMMASARCGARTRAGTPCKSPAVAGKRRCRMHGGAHGSGGQPGNRNAWKTGRYSAPQRAWHAVLRQAVREGRHTLAVCKAAWRYGPAEVELPVGYWHRAALLTFVSIVRADLAARRRAAAHATVHGPVGSDFPKRAGNGTPLASPSPCRPGRSLACEAPPPGPLPRDARTDGPAPPWVPALRRAKPALAKAGDRDDEAEEVRATVHGPVGSDFPIRAGNGTTAASFSPCHPGYRRHTSSASTVPAWPAVTKMLVIPDVRRAPACGDASLAIRDPCRPGRGRCHVRMGPGAPLRSGRDDDVGELRATVHRPIGPDFPLSGVRGTLEATFPLSGCPVTNDMAFFRVPPARPAEGTAP